MGRTARHCRCAPGTLSSARFLLDAKVPMSRIVPRAVLASVLAVSAALLGAAPAGAGVPLSGVVSAAPVAWTPNVFAGTTDTATCQRWFGSGGCGHASVLSTAVVNGEVIVAGAFTQVCQAGPASSGHCQPGTMVTRNDVFAYQLGTGIIDPDFAPQLDQGPAYSVVAGPGNTVYLGGAFTTVTDAAGTHTLNRGLVQLNVTPGNAATDGQVVTAFTGHVNGYVRALAFNGNALYAGGQFSRADSTAETGIARLNATTGAVDPAFGLSISTPAVSGLALKVTAMALSADGKRLAVAGTFLDVGGQPRPRLALISTGGGLGTKASVANWAAPILANNCSAEHDYVRGVDFSPDGSWLVIADTGAKSSPVTAPSVCDAVVRFPAAPTGTSIQPAWVNYSGNDSFYSVQVTGAVVYVGGHFRWVNNECGADRQCEANSVLTMGFAAIDARTGLAVPWFHPLTLRGEGVMSLTTFPAGLYAGSNGGILLGTNVSQIADSYHGFEALFPLNSTTGTPTFGSIPSGMFAQGRIGGHNESTAGIAAMCVDDPGNSTTPGTTVDLASCTNAAWQNWTIQPGGTITLNGLCLDTADGGTASGTQAVLNTCDSGPTQVWTRTTSNALVNSASGLCLDDPGAATTSGTKLDIASCTGDPSQVWPLPATPVPSSLTPTGPVASSVIQSNHQPACLSTTGSSPAPGSAIQMWMCVGGQNENATVASDGTIQLRKLCLDTAGGATTDGTAVVLNTCNGASTQTWRLGSGHTLVNQGAGLCLAASATGNGSSLSVTTCSTSSLLQRWWLPAV
jgi:Ricin-type beta-trefoil lectin domain/Domain of unknown function (DUF5122) beta-propeller